MHDTALMGTEAFPTHYAGNRPVGLSQAAPHSARSERPPQTLTPTFTLGPPVYAFPVALQEWTGDCAHVLFQKAGWPQSET